MSIEKKSLISTLKTTKKANAVSSEAKPTNVTSKREAISRKEALHRREAVSRKEALHRREAVSRKEALHRREAVSRKETFRA